MQDVSRMTISVRTAAFWRSAFGASAVAFVAALGLSSPALSGTVWRFDDVAMSGGTSLNGNFTTNFATGALEAWNITVNGGPYGTGGGYFFSNTIANFAVDHGTKAFEVDNFGGGYINWSLGDSLAGRTLPTTVIHSSFFCQACDNYSVSGTSGSVAAPEPATWALMLLGFGGMGAASRSRRRSTPHPG